MLDALRSAAVEDEEEEGSERVAGGCTGLSTGGAVWRRRAAAVEALVRGPILEKSLKSGERVSVIPCTLSSLSHRPRVKVSLYFKCNISNI